MEFKTEKVIYRSPTSGRKILKHLVPLDSTIMADFETVILVIFVVLLSKL
ncbi:hypothetical protein RintRC_2113 [Richelia intracellularis]|nr:hypothetical protein RintRC_2113 [Richelia intracellularis]